MEAAQKVTPFLRHHVGSCPGAAWERRALWQRCATPERPVWGGDVGMAISR